MNPLVVRALRGAARLSSMAGSRSRLLAIKARYPEVRFEGRVTVGRGAQVSAGRGATLTIQNCAIGRNAWIVAGPGATLSIDADYIGPSAVVVARESIVIGAGSKLAEMVVIRDGNHDHSVPLRTMAFTSAPVSIGADVWLGSGAVVLAGVTIGDGATLAAGAVVTRDVAEGQTVAGVPARVIDKGK